MRTFALIFMLGEEDEESKDVAIEHKDELMKESRVGRQALVIRYIFGVEHALSYKIPALASSPRS